MKFISVHDLQKDEALRKTVVDWVLEELVADLQKNRGNIVCFQYGVAYREGGSEGKEMFRVAMTSKTGGGEELKVLLLLHAVQGLREVAWKYENYEFLKQFRFWHRMALRLLMMLPKL